MAVGPDLELDLNNGAAISFSFMVAFIICRASKHSASTLVILHTI
jgi:hypothetical protein